ncbi:DUF3800 domain-containing protein [Gellertiella hungarica]|uniref:DUF3800 domain-containing protein n=1 Tax=Gellertiella hungarica TaxID=1572859 RepID=A0A7W6J8M2_9HYPH|nr:DUF3800 domain-containing protein [Gellertiella hungarica]MBB4066836.1 hypothetical protein [Gellertiella hungarica]
MTRYRMFVDDTGNVHNSTSNHPQQRYAGVVGVIFANDYLENVFRPGFDRLRERHFGRLEDGSLPILHLRKMKSAGRESIFGCLNDPAKRARWEADCLSMFRRAQFSVIAVGIDKVEFYARHPEWQGSVYDLLVGNAVERYFYFLRNRGQGDVEAEATNSRLDRELKALYRNFFENGTDHIPGHRLQKCLTSREIKIKPKSSENIGLQFADLLASCCLAHLKHLYGSGPPLAGMAADIVRILEERKYYRRTDDSSPHGFGRIWRP